MVSLRPAVASDEELVLEWANEPLARAAGFHVEPISADDHHRWFEQRLKEPQSSRIWIGLEDMRPIGVVRVDLDADGALVVSIALDRASRGQGRSRTLLDAGLAAARAAFPGRRFRALIRHDNAASLALFKGAGFEPASRPPAISPPDAGPEAAVLERG